MSIFENMLKSEISQILYLQSNFSRFQLFFRLVSQSFHRYIFFQYWVPILGIFNYEWLCQLMVASIFSNFTTSFLNWLNSESRPFWWIQETSLYGKERPQLTQFPLTCETTSGGISGHSLAITVFSYILSRKFSSYMLKYSEYNIYVIKFTSFATILFWSISTWGSRVYFATHFLHQCVVGSFIGIFIVRTLFSHNNELRTYITNAGKKKFLSVVLIAALMTGGLYGSFLFIDVDPMWSVRMAFKWCENTRYLRTDSTPVYCVIRDLGALLGLALSAPLVKIKNRNVNKLKSLPAIIFSITLFYVSSLTVPKSYGRWTFIGYTFGQNFLFVFLLLGIIPKLCYYRDKKN